MSGRNFYLTGSREAHSGPVSLPDPHGANTRPHNIIQFPPDGVRSARRPTDEPSGSSLSSRPWGVQLAIDVAAVASAVLVITVTGLSVPIALGLLFFGSF